MNELERAEFSLRRGQLDAAEQICRRVLKASGADTAAMHLLARTLLRQHQPDEALAWVQSVLAVQPAAAPHNTLGLILLEMDRLPEAAAAFDRAIILDYQCAEAYINLGNVLRDLGRYVNARESFRRALALKPQSPEAINGMGTVLAREGRIGEARRCFEQAVQLRSQFPEAHLNLAYSLLAVGEYQRGWEELEWRWRQQGPSWNRPWSKPRWKGEALERKTILLHAEGGLGNTIQFIRYVPAVARLAGRVVLECQPQLKALLWSALPGITLIGQGEPLPVHDMHAPLMSLPHFLKLPIPNADPVPYLRAQPQRIEQWRGRLSPHAEFRVGIAWQGNPRYRQDRERSIPLRHFAPLAKVPDVCLLSLQRVCGLEQTAQNAQAVPLVELGPDLDKEGAFLDTAAVMMNLDLVITSDTSIAHVAGALGVPVWVVLCATPDWRWMLEREDCPWYPSMRLFRQSTSGEWAGVFERVARRLHTLVRERQP